MEIGQRFRKIFLKEPKLFTDKRDLNWQGMKKLGLIGVGVAVLVLLFLPSPKADKKGFHEQGGREVDIDPSRDVGVQPGQVPAAPMRHIPDSLDYLYRQPGSVGGGGSGPKRDAPMVLAREGMDSRNQLPPGSRFMVQLFEKTTVANQSMPVIGVVAQDFAYDSGVAIPQGSKLYGEMSFDDFSERASVTWRVLELPDGRRRQVSAIAVGLDGQPGMEGNVHSDALKNTAGQMVTRFVGAYAEGSMQRGAFGESVGGSDNALKNAVAETAKDRADAWAQDLKKEKKWIELEAGTASFAVLNQFFSFRDPGATYGR